MGIHFISVRRKFRRLIVWGAVAFVGIASLVLFLHIHDGSERMGQGREAAGRLIIGNGCGFTTRNQGWAPERRNAQGAVIYVLGGTQDSLRLKFHTAVALYRRKLAGELMIASMKGITEYSPDKDRNLTNNEWIAIQLTGQGVGCEDIDFIRLQNGFFGTLREARTLKTICREKGIRRLLLVCSAYHSNRVRSIFSATLKDTGVEIEIYTADEQVGLRGLVVEYVKRIFYDIILIPLVRHST